MSRFDPLRKAGNMKFFDAHIHFLHQCPIEELRYNLGLLKKIGFAGLDVLVLAEFPSEINTVLKMIPGGYHPYVTFKALENQRDIFTLLNSSSPLRIMPFLDARFIGKDIEQKMKMYRQMGFRGLKLLYVPEEDKVLRIGGMENAFSRTCKESENITSQLIDSASSQGMPVTIHADLRRYGQFIEEMVRSHPDTNFNLPHFGFSRRAISSLLDKYPNCYTDLSAMNPFMERDAVSYKGFIQSHQDKILFGSDALIDQLDQIQSALNSVGRFLEGDGILHKVMNKNYGAFHGHSGETP